MGGVIESTAGITAARLSPASRTRVPGELERADRRPNRPVLAYARHISYSATKPPKSGPNMRNGKNGRETARPGLPRLRLRQLRGRAPRDPRRDRRRQRRPPGRLRRGRLHRAPARGVRGRTSASGVEVYPVFNGTGANVVGLQSMLPRWGAVSRGTAHINIDEAARPSGWAASSCSRSPTPDGKLTPELSTGKRGGGATSTAPSRWSCRSRRRPSSAPATRRRGDPRDHRPRALARHGVHMDGARISNAAAALGVPLRAFTTRRRRRRAQLRRDEERR